MRSFRTPPRRVSSVAPPQFFVARWSGRLRWSHPTTLGEGTRCDSPGFVHVKEQVRLLFPREGLRSWRIPFRGPRDKYLLLPVPGWGWER
ncbi:hypothetical protein BD310DRAFT_911311 [Dichomitus squalens]|uniref:Uncharacterized protein n=1 Tax=Dichomitus squalens TaxID=114155 RepID=A0A4Q9QCE9_9APHY|nr:hypothetical protein BD310DRAFT_911311 [Dichomitus squalens]